LSHKTLARVEINRRSFGRSYRRRDARQTALPGGKCIACKLKQRPRANKKGAPFGTPFDSFEGS
jgi:hypothetical protein